MAEAKRIPRTLPVITFDSLVIYPMMVFPLMVHDETLKKVIDHALSNDKLLGFFLVRDAVADEPVLYDVGTAVSILRMLRNQDGSISLLLQGVSRLKLDAVTQREPFIKVEAESLPENEDDSTKIQALKKIALEMLEKFISEGSDLSRDLVAGISSIKQPGRVADLIAGNLPLAVEEKQELLGINDVIKRFVRLNKILADAIRQRRMENRIRSSIQLEMDDEQRKFYLREQLDAIKKELGEDSEFSAEKDNWTKRIKAAKLPDEVQAVAEEELTRLSQMSPGSSEYSVITTYLDWIVSLPWNKHSNDRLDLTRIEGILAKDHFGLEKAKERIVEFMAVKKLRNKLKGPILCFAGPPGVGKTSMGRSVARSLNRKFVRISLGGIHDEAEIRGHRRTYVGAMPGKIIAELKRCGTANPVFMLDEIDKLGKDFRGDPSSALLEVLDPEQNFSFQDNYLNLPFDLSEIMFITTANSLETIPAPLRDRMEIIEFSSYLEEEKVEIAHSYLVPKERENNGLTQNHIRIGDDALREMCRYYVREAGVRNLQRTIATIMRKVARQVAGGDTKRKTVTAAGVKDYLGRRKFSLELAGRKPEVGVVTGMAWTAYGGEILFCEATAMPGKGALTMTGLLGKVMRESAGIAMSHIRANYQTYGIDPDKFNKNDFHIHLPSGAVPKDGPSAGVTLTTALVSLLTGRKVRHDVAMTGEITLLGKVLEIGGVREKILAAKRSGITKVLLPAENQDSFEEVDKRIREGLDVKFCTHISEVLEEVLLPE